MSADWLLLMSGPNDAAWNMALDEALLETAPQINAPVLRFYEWKEPAASFGYFQKFQEIERATLLRPLVRRPTGGGLVPHDGDWTYSLVFPPGHFWHELKAVESYERVHAWVRDAFARMSVATVLSPCCQKDIPGQCFLGAEKFDVLWHGRKIAGAAQRRTKTGLLIQGSVQPPPLRLKRADWEAAMQGVASEQFSIFWKPMTIHPSLEGLTRQLAENKYTQADYNQKR